MNWFENFFKHSKTGVFEAGAVFIQNWAFNIFGYCHSFLNFFNIFFAKYGKKLNLKSF